MDEVADLNERVDVRMEEVEGDVGTLKEEVVELRSELRELREAHCRLSRQVGELNTLVEDMQRHLCLPRTPDTGGKGSFTQWVHGGFIVGSETICLPNIHWVQGEYF